MAGSARSLKSPSFGKRDVAMSRHNKMPPVPPANRSPKGTGGNPGVEQDTSSKKKEENYAEQGDTANIRENTTNAGYFHGRRVK
jgi:hypothetical protein